MTDTPTVAVIWPTVPDAMWARVREIAEEVHGTETPFYMWQPDMATLDKMQWYFASRGGVPLTEMLQRAAVHGQPVAIIYE